MSKSRSWCTRPPAVGSTRPTSDAGRAAAYHASPSDAGPADGRPRLRVRAAVEAARWSTSRRLPGTSSGARLGRQLAAPDHRPGSVSGPAGRGDATGDPGGLGRRRWGVAPVRVGPSVDLVADGSAGQLTLEGLDLEGQDQPGRWPAQVPNPRCRHCRRRRGRRTGRLDRPGTAEATRPADRGEERMPS